MLELPGPPIQIQAEPFAFFVDTSCNEPFNQSANGAVSGFDRAAKNQNLVTPMSAYALSGLTFNKPTTCFGWM
jgi:hypothetical protein